MYHNGNCRCAWLWEKAAENFHGQPNDYTPEDPSVCAAVPDSLIRLLMGHASLGLHAQQNTSMLNMSELRSAVEPKAIALESRLGLQPIRLTLEMLMSGVYTSHTADDYA